MAVSGALSGKTLSSAENLPDERNCKLQTRFGPPFSGSKRMSLSYGGVQDR